MKLDIETMFYCCTEEQNRKNCNYFIKAASDGEDGFIYNMEKPEWDKCMYSHNNVCVHFKARNEALFDAIERNKEKYDDEETNE